MLSIFILRNYLNWPQHAVLFMKLSLCIDGVGRIAFGDSCSRSDHRTRNVSQQYCLHLAHASFHKVVFGSAQSTAMRMLWRRRGQPGCFGHPRVAGCMSRKPLAAAIHWCLKLQRTPGAAAHRRSCTQPLSVSGGSICCSCCRRRKTTHAVICSTSRVPHASGYLRSSVSASPASV